MHPLDGTRLKLSRAEKHLNAVKDLIDNFISRNPYTFPLEQNPQLPGWNVVARVKQIAPDNELSCVIGDFAHNARSALNLLVNQLSSLPIEDHKRQVLQFPIFDTTKGYTDHVNSYLFGVAPENIAIIQEIQPYNGVDGPDNDALAILAAINNADKHRIIHVVGAVASFEGFGFWGPSQVGSNIIRGNSMSIMVGQGSSIDFDGFRYESVGDGIITKDGTIVAQIIINPHVYSNVNMHPKAQISVKFDAGDSRVKGRTVLDTLTFIYDRVKEVVRKFEPFFPE